MKFSIVIPAHNGEKFLKQAIESALNQTRPADEVIVVDDASKDGTSLIAHDYGSQIEYFHNPASTGFVDAWNRAVSLAHGDFVTILHQDDLLHPEYLSHIEKASQRFPMAKHFYTACNYIDADGAVTWKAALPYSLEPIPYSGNEYAHNYLDGVVKNCHIHRCPGVTTSRELLLSQCAYRREAGHIADDDFFLRVGMFTDVVGISQPLASFRHHRESETGRLASLTLTLARDYLFQSEYYRNNSTLLDNDDVEKVHNMAVRFINLLLFQSIRDGNTESGNEALYLKGRLDAVLPGFMERVLPLWGRILWNVSTRRKGKFISRAYVSILDNAINIRIAVKKIAN